MSQLEVYAEYLRRTLNEALEKIADLEAHARDRDNRLAEMRKKLAYYAAIDVSPRMENKKLGELFRVNENLRLKIEANEKLLSDQRKEIRQLKAENQRLARRQVTTMLTPQEPTPILPIGRSYVSA